MTKPNKLYDTIPFHMGGGGHMQLLFPGYYVCYYVGYYIGYYVGYYIGYYVMLLFIPVKMGGPYPRLRDFLLLKGFNLIWGRNVSRLDNYVVMVYNNVVMKPRSYRKS